MECIREMYSDTQKDGAKHTLGHLTRKGTGQVRRSDTMIEGALRLYAMWYWQGVEQ